MKNEALENDFEEIIAKSKDLIITKRDKPTASIGVMFTNGEDFGTYVYNKDIKNRDADNALIQKAINEK